MNAKNDSYRSKVARLIDKYELRGVGKELEHRWTRDEGRDSLRVLTEYFNKQLLETAIKASEYELIDGDIDNLYRILTMDDVSSGVRRETENQLSKHGVDVDTLETDFVTYQAIRTYLQKYRGVETPSRSRTEQSHRETKRSTIQQLMSRLDTVTTEALSELKDAGHLTLGEFEVIISANVHCSGCGTRISVTELLRQGSCDCSGED